jgi:hypothetical protein
MPKINLYFLHPKRVEEFVAATASLTAFYYLLEANNLADYNCAVSNVTLLRGEYQQLRCSAIGFPELFHDSENCTLTSPDPDLNCYTLQRLARECGWPPKSGQQSSTAELLVSVLLGVTLVCLIALLYFSTDGESDEEKEERVERERKRRRRPGLIGCTNGPYHCSWLRSIRTFACLASWGTQLGTRIYYGVVAQSSLCKTVAYTTQTGLLYLWPIAMLGTLLAAYTPLNVVPTPIRFGQLSFNEKRLSKLGAVSNDDGTTTELPAVHDSKRDSAWVDGRQTKRRSKSSDDDDAAAQP